MTKHASTVAKRHLYHTPDNCLKMNMDKNQTVKPGSMRAWMLAARPKTLTCAAVPVLIGTTMAWADSDGSIIWVPTALCLLFAFVMQIDANFINDYFDFIHGNDDESRLGPKRACAQGWIGVKQMRIAIIITTLLACAIGMPLIYYGGLEMILIGILCVLFCFLYSTTLSYLGLGDILVLVFFGVVPVCITYYLAMPDHRAGFSAEVILASIACGIVIDGLLIVNNYRDMDNDRKAGKITLMVRIGAAASRAAYLSTCLIACALGIVHIFYDKPFAFVLPLAFLPLNWLAYQKVCHIGKGRELNTVLETTARNIFIYGILTAIGCIL